MRELKFRAWLDEYKQYIYFGGDYKEQTGRWGKGRCALLGNNYIAELYANEDNSNMFYQVHKVKCIEQCTGLKDKNGKEIYEGDIVSEEFKYGGEKTKTIWQVMWCDDECAFELHYVSGFEVDDCSLVADDEEDYEVIGNIHENQELLEQHEKLSKKSRKNTGAKNEEQEDGGSR